MNQQKILFNKKLYEECKKELVGADARKIILNYNKKISFEEKHEIEFLSYYYSPILTILRQLFNDFKGKFVLEIGYRVPFFLEYLKERGVVVFGIDKDPYLVRKNFLKMSVDKLSTNFLKKNKGKFDAVIERITLSKLYDKNFFLETGKYRFKDKEKILVNLSCLLKKKGFLILQDDVGTIFTDLQLKKSGFKKIMNEINFIFKDKNNKNLGRNVLVVYQKIIN